MSGLSEGQLDQYLAEDPGGPVAMLNLLRFKPDGGAERYLEYVAAVQQFGPRFGLELVFAGTGDTALVAGPGHDWDMVAIVQYPSRQAFVEMVRSPEYQAVEHLRAEALIDATLQATRALPV
jgi:uncharacterized protein (DUF1330 family)